ncbi:MAG: hypothetical protein GXX86_07690 [Propionibacterium sp.]|nr:hypothetical protein [Propionibacterium sp.]
MGRAPLTGIGETLRLAGTALRGWTLRQTGIAVLGAVVVGLIIGIATVLIPNPIFARDIPPVWWNYPVWLLTAALSGVLIATYVRSSADQSAEPEPESAEEQRSGKLGMAGGILAWFAVGCPVCNKLALLALGYSGAITWFAPVQPYLALAAMVLTGVAVLWRLRGQVACPMPVRATAR